MNFDFGRGCAIIINFHGWDCSKHVLSIHIFFCYDPLASLLNTREVNEAAEGSTDNNIIVAQKRLNRIQERLCRGYPLDGPHGPCKTRTVK